MESNIKNFLENWLLEVQETDLKTKFELFLIDEIQGKINEQTKGTKMNFLTSEELCKKLNINPRGVTNIEIKAEANSVPLLVVTKLLESDFADYLSDLKNTVEYREVIEDPRNIILMEEMNKFFYDKLAETGSLDKAMLKAVWRAYLKGIQVGSNSSHV